MLDVLMSLSGTPTLKHKEIPSNAANTLPISGTVAVPTRFLKHRTCTLIIFVFNHLFRTLGIKCGELTGDNTT